jgi:DNA modification methylase
MKIENNIYQVIDGVKEYALLLGNSFDILKQIPNNSIDCAITSPPYWKLREYEPLRYIVWVSLRSSLPAMR